MDVINKTLNNKFKKIGVKSELPLSDNNIILKYFEFFKVHYDINKNSWKINKDIFKIYFLNYSRRKYMDEFIKISDKDYDTEVDAKGSILYFLIKSEFIDASDINNI